VAVGTAVGVEVGTSVAVGATITIGVEVGTGVAVGCGNDFIMRGIIILLLVCAIETGTNTGKQTKPIINTKPKRINRFLFMGDLLL